MNDHMFYLAQDIFIRGFTDSGMKGDVPELSCVAIKAAHEFIGIWDSTQTVLEGETQKAVETSIAMAAKEKPVSKPEPKAPVKQKRRKAKG